VDRFINKSTK